MRCVVALLFVLVLAGCASTDHVLFVTKTSVGIDFDLKPGTASIGYDRVEGYLAPRYSNGEIPPVVASVKSDGRIFNPAIRQVYATGDAAVIATGGPRKKRNQPMKGDGELMFFGTTTTTGFKVGFTTGLPDSFVFGFKRKEYSYIPLAAAKEEKDDKGQTKPGRHIYPSVLASIDTAANVATDGTITQTALTNAQFFATGTAARNLASTRRIQDSFIGIATEAMAAQQKKNVQDAQANADAINSLVDDILADFSADDTSATQKQLIVDAAKAVGIDKDNKMTVSNFEKQLAEYSGTAPTAEARTKLQALYSRVEVLKP